MEEHFHDSSAPIILSSRLGLMWGAAMSEHLDSGENNTSYIVIGPVLSAPVSVQTLQKAVHDYGIDLSWRKGFINMMQSIPIVSPQTFFQYVLMLHYCASGEKLSRSEIAFQENKTITDKKKKNTEESIAAARFATYRIEQELLENIRNGNLGYSSSLDRAYQLSNGVRVHQHLHSRKYSGPVQSCVEYIEMHIQSSLSLEDLSKRLGYTAYYLSHKFKKETGISMKQYIKNLRLEKAKTLLVTTDYSVAQISEMLHFCSSSYFSSQFCQKEGILPQEFRKQNQRL